MASPLPGMDPFLEDEKRWPAFQPLVVHALYQMLLPGLMDRYPGTVTLRLDTYAALIRDILDSLKHAGFRRILVVNGHGGNQPASLLVREWMMDNPDARVRAEWQPR